MQRTVTSRVMLLAGALVWVWQDWDPTATLAAQGRSLSKITGQQLVQLLKLPPGASLHDPTVDCRPQTTSPCNKDLLETISQTVFAWQADDGSMKEELCPESRRFLPGSQVVPVIIVIGFCNQGGFTKSTHKSSIDAANLWTRRLLLPSQEHLSSEELAQRKLLETVVAPRRFWLDPFHTVDTFLLVGRGHPGVFVPTATITSTRDEALFVIQFYVFDIWKTGDRPQDLALFNIHDLLSATAKALHQTMR